MTRSVVLEPPPRVMSFRWAWVLLLAVVLAIGAGAALDRLRGVGEAPLDPGAIRTGFGPKTFAEAIVMAERDVAEARMSYAYAPYEWLRGEVLAGALMERWRLTNDYADLAEAERLLDAGLATTPDPAGPAVSKAALAVLVHRLDQAEAALARARRSAAPDPADIADATALAGDVALQRGQLDHAAGLFAQADRLVGTSGTGMRNAMLIAGRGAPRSATAALESLIARPRQQPATLAALMLQRANLAYAAGDWAEAGRWVGAAQRTFPGYWLADAYAAQQFALAGRNAEATRAYIIVAERTGRPEVMDALAHLLRLQGRGAESRAWAAKAAAGWSERAALFPEAVAHHRAEHELAVGSASRALALAQADARARPHAPNLVLLARALVAAGRPREALAALDRADAQGWVSAGQLMARAEVAAALGDTATSEAARAKALAINPRAADPRARLIWFGHD